MPLRRIAIASVSSTACLLGSTIASASPHHHPRPCPHADTPANQAPRAAIRAAVVCLIDRQRHEHGLPALRVSTALNRSAQRWTDRMVRTRHFTHGVRFEARIAAIGLRPSAAGENIATGFATPRQVVRGWMSSEGHCRNILDPNYTLVGTGVVSRVVGAPGGGRATWTQDFATRRGAQPRSRPWGPVNTVC